jgi:hypothetical protein
MGESSMSDSNSSTRPAFVLLVIAILAFVGMGYVVATQVSVPPVPQNIDTTTAAVIGGLTLISLVCFVAFIWGALGNDPSDHRALTKTGRIMLPGSHDQTTKTR